MMANTTGAVFRITALWAFSECALGGVMHALKIPFTGIIVGGFSVLSIGMLAHVSGRSAAAILRATLLVVLVKAVVSPHSPPTAYLAVGFQGLAGALILSRVRPFALAAYLFGFLAILESALQKILVLLLFFGKSLFEAFDLFAGGILDDFGIHNEVSWSVVAAGCYIALYAAWGLVLGYWITRLPGQLERRAAEYALLNLSGETAQAPVQGKKKNRWLMPLLVLVFIVSVFLFAGGKASGAQKAWYAVLRTAAALLAWFFLLQPVVAWFIHRWAASRSASEKGAVQQILASMPEWQASVGPIYRHVAAKHRGWRRIRAFVIGMFVLAVYDIRETDGQQL